MNLEGKQMNLEWPVIPLKIKPNYSAPRVTFLILCALLEIVQYDVENEEKFEETAGEKKDIEKYFVATPRELPYSP